MSTIAESSWSRRFRRSAEQDIPSLENFNDQILQHILSFLPTKYSVRTSILSRRWRYLWTYVNNLDFQEEENGLPSRRQHFMNFVDRVLLIHDVSCAKRFSLSCKVGSDAQRINAWISAAIWRNAEEFDIRFTDVNNDRVLPFSLFNSDKVKVLKLDAYCELKLPSQFSLPSLKTLVLRNCSLVDDLSTQLLFLSQTLEKLVLDECNWLGLHNLILSTPKLWSLTICEPNWDESLGNGCEVMIHGNGLKDFNYTGSLKGDYHLFTTSKIANVSLNVPIHNHNCSEAKTVHKLLKGVSDVKNLKLSSNAVKALKNATELFIDKALLIFDNLTCLELGPEPVDFSCTALHLILQKCLFVETLKLTEGISQSHKLDCLLRSELTSFLSHLTKLEVREFKGEEDELFAMQILLPKAVVLETLLVYFVGPPSEKRVTEFLLSIIPRGSESTDIVLI